MATNNTKLFIAIAVFLALAVFGAAVFSGFGNKDGAVPAVEETIGESSLPPVDETANADATEQEQSATTDTADVSGGQGFDLNAALGTRGIGNPNASIKIVEFASLTCNHCASFHKDVLPGLKEKYIDTGKVYLEFQEFPLNAPALDASLLARCLPTERYESFTGLLFKTQDDWTTRPDYLTVLKQNAKLAGLSDEGAEQCLQSNELRQAIGERIQQASEKYKISSTPTFIINDGAEILRGALPLEEFEKAMAKLSGEAPAVTPTEEAPAVDDAAPVEETPAETAPVEEPIQQ